MRLRGESTNATFAKTILYLLRRRGPMATEELHPHIQRIHPDLCDDSVDRVVAGENYGKTLEAPRSGCSEYSEAEG